MSVKVRNSKKPSPTTTKTKNKYLCVSKKILNCIERYFISKCRSKLNIVHRVFPSHCCPLEKSLRIERFPSLCLDMKHQYDIMCLSLKV